MKIFDAIKAKRLNQKAPITRFARIDATCSAIPNLYKLDQFEWRIGAEVFCRLSGPAKAHEHTLRKAMDLIAKEVYGEIVDDLIELERILLEEQYRPTGDPAINAIHSMIMKMRGEK